MCVLVQQQVYGRLAGNADPAIPLGVSDVYHSRVIKIHLSDMSPSLSWTAFVRFSSRSPSRAAIAAAVRWASLLCKISVSRTALRVFMCCSSRVCRTPTSVWIDVTLVQKPVTERLPRCRDNSERFVLAEEFCGDHKRWFREHEEA